ncbi:MAG: hypothetical protein ABIJ00_11005 [Candidatus Eisenbacteria bacterium]
MRNKRAFHTEWESEATIIESEIDRISPQVRHSINLEHALFVW